MVTKIELIVVHKKNQLCRYKTFEKTQTSDKGWHRDREKYYQNTKRRESNSLKLKIIQNYKEACNDKSASPTDEIFRTPNTTLDADDSIFDQFSTPIGNEFGILKMKSMNNLNLAEQVFEDKFQNPKYSLTKSISRSERELFDTPVELVNLRKDFEMNRFEEAKLESRIQNEDVIDGAMSKDEVDGKNYAYSRFSLQNPKRVGNTKYIGADSADIGSNQLMKMRSMGMINDIIRNGGTKNDPFWNNNKKYNKNLILPTRLDEKFTIPEPCENDEEIFKIPSNPLRKEKSSSCIENIKNRGTVLYDRIR
jgi:hypothetical protein